MTPYHAYIGKVRALSYTGHRKCYDIKAKDKMYICMGMGCLYRVFIPREMEDNFLLTDNSKTKRASERQSEKNITKNT